MKKKKNQTNPTTIGVFKKWKESWAWWYTSVIQATQEVETGLQIPCQPRKLVRAYLQNKIKRKALGV
jgi:hypothetical protein